MNYEPLAIEITQDGGHHYRQIWRDDYAAVYEQRNAFDPFLVIERLAEDENRVFVKSRNPNMVSTKKAPQARPPSRETTSLKKIAIYPDTKKNQNLDYEVVRYGPKFFRQRHDKHGGLS